MTESKGINYTEIDVMIDMKGKVKVTIGLLIFINLLPSSKKYIIKIIKLIKRYD